MCFWISDSKEFRGAKIADRDIVCYKESFRSSFLGVSKKSFSPSVYSEFEYALNVPAPNVKIRSSTCFSSRCVNEGYHSYKKKQYTCPIVGKFIIPKGTRYYENETQYVSETLIFKGYIK